MLTAAILAAPPGAGTHIGRMPEATSSGVTSPDGARTLGAEGGHRERDRGGVAGPPERYAMDQLLLVLLILAVVGAIAAILLGRSRRRAIAAALPAPESPFAVSTEGMKICPKCGMGNLWTERKCSACGASLRG